MAAINVSPTNIRLVMLELSARTRLSLRAAPAPQAIQCHAPRKRASTRNLGHLDGSQARPGPFRLFVGDAPFTRTLHQADVLRQRSAICLERRAFPRGTPRLQ